MEKLPKDLIPNLDDLYKATCEFVKNHQGEKGYIDTQDPELDTIYAIEWDEEMGHGVETKVHGVCYKEEYDALLIVTEPIMRTYQIEYTPDSFGEDADWMSVRYSDVYYIPTLFNIAENIHEYVD